jgi:hypothetical protein
MMREGFAEKAAPAREGIVSMRIDSLEEHPAAQPCLNRPRHAGSLHETVKAEEGFHGRQRHRSLVSRGGLRVCDEREGSRIIDNRHILRHSTSRAGRNVVGRCVE